MPSLGTKQRSALLAQLLRDMERRNAHTGNRTVGEGALRVLGNFLTQKNINKKLEEQAAADKTQQKVLENAIGQQLGGAQQSVFGTVKDEQGNPVQATPQSQNASLAQALSQDPDNKLLQQIAAQKMAPPKPKENPFQSLGTKEVRPEVGDPFDASIFHDTETNRLGFFDKDGKFTAVAGNRLGPSKTRSEVTNVPVDERGLNTEAVEVNEASGRLRRNLMSTMTEIDAAPGTVGARGRAAGVAGGLVGNMFGPDAGQWVTQVVAGQDQRNLGAIQARLKTVKAQLIPVVTGETSGRFTDTEQRLAGEAISLVDKIVDLQSLSANFPAFQGAMRELTIASFESQFEQARFSDAVDPPYDLNSREDVLALANDLVEVGFTEEEMDKAMARFRRIHSGR